MTVRLREISAHEGQASERRRGRRMNSQVPVRLEWQGPGGKTTSFEAHTRIVNPYGCMVVLPDSLDLEQRVARGRPGRVIRSTPSSPSRSPRRG